MFEDIALGAAVGMLIFFFFILDYWLFARGGKKERTVKFQKGERPGIPCPYCGTLLRPSDRFCRNCDTPRKKHH